MWYEAIPSAILTIGFFYYVPQYGLNWITWLDTNGRWARRNNLNPRNSSLTRRDEYLTGNYYVTNGLEVIPDLPETSEKKD